MGVTGLSQMGNALLITYTYNFPRDANNLIREFHLKTTDQLPEAQEGFRVSKALGDARAKMVHTDPDEYQGPIVEGNY